MARTIIVTVGAAGVITLILAPVGTGRHGRHGGAIWPLGQWGRHHLFANIFLLMGYGLVLVALCALAFLTIRGLFKLADWD